LRAGPTWSGPATGHLRRPSELDRKCGSDPLPPRHAVCARRPPSGALSLQIFRRGYVELVCLELGFAPLVGCLRCVMVVANRRGVPLHCEEPPGFRTTLHTTAAPMPPAAPSSRTCASGTGSSPMRRVKPPVSTSRRWRRSPAAAAGGAASRRARMLGRPSAVTAADGAQRRRFVLSAQPPSRLSCAQPFACSMSSLEIEYSARIFWRLRRARHGGAVNAARAVRRGRHPVWEAASR
jgi:hypothetical protein